MPGAGVGAHELGKDVGCYTGFTFEELLGRVEAMELLVETDVLVDGRFIEELRTLELPFRGSSNQRLIDVKKSLEAGKAIEYKL
jgi:anaerobic ribonucleoside-triphosphate reductase activating protein